MTTTTLVPTAARPPPTDSAARVSFRQPVTASGFVDAGWWPRTRDLTAELPTLLELLWDVDRDITRVSFNLDAWQPAPRRMQLHGKSVRLGGFHHQSPLLVTLTNSWGHDRIDLLVIPPETDAATARHALDLASATDGTDRPEHILEEAVAHRGS